MFNSTNQPLSVYERINGFDNGFGDYEFGNPFRKKNTAKKITPKKTVKLLPKKTVKLPPKKTTVKKPVLLKKNTPKKTTLPKKNTTTRPRTVQVKKVSSGTAGDRHGQSIPFIQTDPVQLSTITTRPIEALSSSIFSNPSSSLSQPVIVQNSNGSIFDKLFGIGSQIVSGWSKNPTVQTADGQIPIYSMPTNQNNVTRPNGDNFNSGNMSSNGTIETTAQTIGGGLGGIFDWARENLGIVAVGAVAAFLFFKEPPRYGNRR